MRLTRLHRYDLEHMAAAEPPVPDFVVEHIAARGEATVVYGPPGICKSFTVQTFAYGVATGQAVAGLECKLGRVLYLDAENGEAEVHRRVHSLGLPADRVAIYDATTASLRKHAKQVAAVVELEQPDLLVVDSFRRLTRDLDENDSGAMAEMVAFLQAFARDYACAVVAVHHSRKDKQNYRGSSAIGDQVSINWEMERNEQDRTLRVMRCHKTRVEAEPADIWLRVVNDNGHLAIAEAQAADAPAKPQQPKRSALKDEILDLLDGKKAPRSKIAKVLGRAHNDTTLRRALDDLVRDGELVHIAGKYAAVRDEGVPGAA